MINQMFILPLLLVLSARQAAPAPQSAQPATQATPRQLPSPSAPVTAESPSNRPAPTPTRTGRGGVAGPGPAVGGEIDETPVVTHHTITVRGRTMNYTATVAQMPLKDSAGETEAHIFYMAYTLDGSGDTKRR